jgi:hypothetical protein
MSRRSGWHGDSRRHSLAARGIRTNSTKPNPSMARLGENNGRWKGGVSKTYYRKICDCKPNDRKIVHHLDHDKENPDPSNLEVLNNRGISALAKHNKLHPEKGERNKYER